MILTDREIKQQKIMDPCNPKTIFRGISHGLSCCGYDVRVDLSNLDEWHDYRHVMTPDGDGIILEPGQSILVGIVEHFDIPLGVVGFAKDKSTWARQGLFVAQAVLEPGWRGYLSLRIANIGGEELTIVDKSPISQIVFQWLSGVPENTYSGKYQGEQRGAQGPRFES